MTKIKEQIKNKARILGYPVNVVDIKQATNIVEHALDNKEQMHIVTLNPEMIISAQKDPELDKCLNSSDFLIPDGAGILLGLNLQGIKLKHTTPGIELAENCIKYCANKNIPVALIGAKEEVISKTIEKLSNKYPGLNVSYYRNGYFSEEMEEEIAIEAANRGPGLILIALGVPKQELWINKYKHHFTNSVLIGVGGSFDVWSGITRRAPKIFQSLKLEWFYRLIKEPFRAKRMLTTLPYFAWQVLLYRPQKD